MSPGRPDETPEERADRNFGELLQELRVAQTGVQILFGFLITMPLQQRFSQFDDVQRGLFVADVLILASAGVLLIAPVAWHRVLFRQQLKAEVVSAANRLAQLGLALLGLGIVVSIMLVIDVAISRTTALACAGGLAVLVLTLWLVLPARKRVRDGVDHGEP